MSSSLAIIAARGGSKRLPGKNVRPFFGKPMLAWVVDAARDSGLFTELMVSTDDPAVAEVGRAAGAAVPFLRSGASANDTAPLLDVVLEVLDAYAAQGRQFELVTLFLGTAALTTSDLIRSVADRVGKDADGAMPVVRFGFPILRALRLRSGIAEMMWPEHMLTRSNDLEPAFQGSGQFYVAKAQALRAERCVYLKRMAAVEVPETHVQDIDNEEDWRMAELKFRMLHRRPG